MADDARITFQRLAEADFPLLHRWLNDSEVALFYGVGDDNRKNPTMEEVIEEYEPRLKPGAATHSFITLRDGRQVGYIQCYRVGDYAEYAKAIDLDDDAWAIDLYFGEDDARGRGLGARVIERFLEEQVFSLPGVTTCLLCPEPENERGIRAYEKAGFRHVKTVWVAEEKVHAYVMRRDRDKDA